ncbi:DMT family transporter [uncultured Roseibium sp.]|uniref:DMT family transporter n=1 Tax=uncultured Roseibium sp. TaxID=1936171 RepID=UPI002610E2D3|nr:DMT family transporter [uncultured Roseibium sp.]
MTGMARQKFQTEPGTGGKRQRRTSGGQNLLELPLVLLLIVGAFLGISTLFAKAAPELGWHPVALLQWSILGGAVGLFTATRLAGFKSRRNQGRTDKAPLRQLLVYVFITGILFILPNMIAVAAAPKVGAGFVALCYAFPLVLTYAFAVVLRLQRFQLLMAGGVLSGVAGGVLLAISGAQLSAEASFWSALALSIPFFLAAGNIYRTLKWPKGAKPVDLALGMMAIGFLALAAFTASWGIPVIPTAWTTQAVTLLAAQTAIFGLQYGLYFRLQQTAGPVYLSQIGSVAAVVGLVLGYLVFNEVPNAAKISAVAFVGIGIVLVTIGQRRLMAKA